MSVKSIIVLCYKIIRLIYLLRNWTSLCGSSIQVAECSKTSVVALEDQQCRGMVNVTPTSTSLLPVRWLFSAVICFSSRWRS